MRLTTLSIAWRNLGRNRRRTALALAAIAVGQTSLLLYDGILNGVIDRGVRDLTGPVVGHVQVQAPGWHEDRAVDRVLEPEALAAVRAAPGVARVAPRIYAPLLAAVGEEGHAVLAFGVDPAAESGPDGLLARVPPAERPQGRSVLVGHLLARELEVKPGGEVALVGQAADGSLAAELYRVSGLLSVQVDAVNRSGVVMSLDAARELLALPAGTAHELMVYGRDVERAPALAARLSALPQLDGARVQTWREALPAVVGLLELSRSAGLVVLVLVFVAAAAGIANTMMMATFERQRELGMLLALGCKPGRVVRIVLAEAVALGIVGVAAGTAAGLAAVAYFHRAGFDFRMFGGGPASISFGGLEWSLLIYPSARASDALSGLAAVAVTAFLSALWPAARAARLEPVQALRA